MLKHVTFLIIYHFPALLFTFPALSFFRSPFTCLNCAKYHQSAGKEQFYATYTPQKFLPWSKAISVTEYMQRNNTFPLIGCRMVLSEIAKCSLHDTPALNTDFDAPLSRVLQHLLRLLSVLLGNDCRVSLRSTSTGCFMLYWLNPMLLPRKLY